MKKIYIFLFILSLINVSVIGQNNYVPVPNNLSADNFNLDSEYAPNTNHSNSLNSSKALWTIQLDADPTAISASLAGVMWTGTEFWCAVWNSADIFTADASGNSTGSFTIPGVSGTRSMTSDGSHVYIGAAGSDIYKVDPATQTLVSTISTSVSSCRYLTYDPTLNSNAGGFWTGAYGSDITAVDMSGATLSTISSATHGLTGIYGMSYDNFSAGGPFLWAFDQGGNDADIIQLDMSGNPTGVMHDANSDLSAAGGGGGLAGGLFICDNFVTGTTSMIGINQGESLFSYELADPFSIDVAGVAVTTAPYLAIANAPFTISGEVNNVGLSTINSMDINYSINGGAAVTQSLTGLNIPLGSNHTFNHSSTWTPTSTGTYQIDIWASNINGMADMNTANDMVSGSVMVYDVSTQRIPLFETFTSSTCPPCVPGNIQLESILSANPNNYTSLKYQMSFPGAGDPYFTDEGGSRRSYYGISSVPRLEIDGGWDSNPNSLTQQDFDNNYSIPSFTNLTASYSVAGQSVQVDVSVDPIDNISSNNLVVHIAVFEYLTTGNVGSNGETEFQHVMKKMLPGSSGNAISSLQAGVSQTVSQSYDFNGSYRLPNDAQSPINHAIEHSVEEFSDLGVAVWVQDATTKEVLQSTTATLVVGLNNENKQLLSAKVYPNPVIDNATLAINLMHSGDVNIKVYNSIGEEVIDKSINNLSYGRTIAQINTSKLPGGLYTISLISGEERIVKKMQVIK
jgi:hypothetical protein